MIFVELYKGWEIIDSEVGYYLIIRQGDSDYEQVPFATVLDAKDNIDMKERDGAL